MRKKVSIIVPIKDGVLCQEVLRTLNELESDQRISPQSYEVIIVNTLTPCHSNIKDKYNVIEDTDNSRAHRINIGAEKSSGETLLLLHPRSYLSSCAIHYLINENSHCWGGFTHSFNISNPFYKLTSWYSNNIRAKIREIFYLDHCIFIDRALFFQVGAIPQIDIFEDTALSEKLRKVTAGTLLPFISMTSTIRFETNGKIKQAILNQILKLAYLSGVNHKRMNKIYEIGLNLNSKY